MFVSILVFFSCLGLGLIVGYMCISRLVFDLKFGLPLTRRNEERGKLRRSWRGGKLESIIRRNVIIRAVAAGLVTIGVTWFCIWGGNLLTGFAGLICFLGGAAVFAIAAGNGDVNSPETLRQYREKYHDYMV